MALVSHPANPWLLGLGTAAVGVQAVPFGLAAAAIVPRELEGTLVVIGVVGMQMSAGTQVVLAKVLPFYGPRKLIDVGVTGHGAIAVPLLVTLCYGLGLFAVALALMGPRLAVQRLGSRA
jgi:hypothetical protein